MKNLNVLLLGWDLLPAGPEALKTSCFAITQALAERVNLTVVLPQIDPVFVLPQVELTGLDQVDLAAIPVNRPQLQDLPYANQAYIRRDIPLYGATEPGNNPPEHPGQQQATGTFAQLVATTHRPGKGPHTSRPEPNIFKSQDFEALALDAQVIQYARYTTRWAAQRPFDVIYAYNYRTFLAGMELKLVSGKKLILQVDSLSYERPHPNSKGWMFALEQLALQKADYIFVNTQAKADILVRKYGISPAVIQSLEKEEAVAINRIRAKEDLKAANLTLSHYAARVQAKEEVTQPSDMVWQVLQQLAAA